ncbi:serine dehydratase beta chain [Escherichia coli]
MFKAGIGPASSHPVGPMKWGNRFDQDRVEKACLVTVTRFPGRFFSHFPPGEKPPPP